MERDRDKRDDGGSGGTEALGSGGSVSDTKARMGVTSREGLPGGPGKHHGRGLTLTHARGHQSQLIIPHWWT